MVFFFIPVFSFSLFYFQLPTSPFHHPFSPSSFRNFPQPLLLSCVTNTSHQLHHPPSIPSLQPHSLSSLIQSNPFVVNLSSNPLTTEQMSRLSKGLNFCPTPGDPDLADVRNDLDRVHQRLRQKQHFLHPSQTTSYPPFRPWV